MHQIQEFKGHDRAVDVTPEIMRQVYRRFVAPLAPSSRMTIKYALSRMADGLGILPVDGDLEVLPWHTVTADQFSDLMIALQGELEPPTIRLYMFALRGITRACFIAGLMPAAQFALIKEVKMPRGRNQIGRGRMVEDRFLKAVLKCCREDERVQGVRDAALIALIFGSGVRRAEAASIDHGSIDLREGEFRVRTKGSKWVLKYLQAWAIPFIEEWLAVRRQEGLTGGAVFTSIVKGGRITRKRLTGRGIFYILEERSKLAGLDFHIRPHDGRRTLGTKMIEEHGELFAQRVLGHADLSTTRIYDKRADSVIKQVFKSRV